ncbi:DUF7667 family protein [Salibacterium aidingense]|uniref:DUF7667 family protein n=1 Tax=Salibacterium aidingense TaxID=384933 RepID=UPI0005584621|nr:hypothetical protein [Salibacterium aidingense]
MNTVHARYMELLSIQTKRPLTAMERKELIESKQYVENYLWEFAKLKNLSYMAYISKDYGWLHDICRELDQLQGGDSI